MNKTINALERMNLHKSEAIVYMLLVQKMGGTVEEISKEVRFKKQNTYTILNKLIQKGFVDVEKSNPVIYHVVPPTETFRKEQIKILDELYTANNELNFLYEANINKLKHPINLIQGFRPIIKKEINLIKSAKKTLNMKIGFLFFNEAQILINVFENLKNTGVKINIIANQACTIDNEKIEVLNKFKNCDVNVKEDDLPNTKVILVDGSEMMQIFPRFPFHENIYSDNVHCTYNYSKNIAKTYNDRFNHQLKLIV
ncbi:sugar-specific transcriptional regulator TrmB [Methanobrevibacter cuticularis]|uniref:Sugar-specific transcriptional regulator TrmB n=2 Tax=Methanobrevibacter cuticularis TaxID=47311 RepID=A0A166CIG0_9EURY|nr:sugar-specific transcriptional regulator TrmB [Methanobrevibacter cuticularis]